MSCKKVAVKQLALVKQGQLTKEGVFILEDTAETLRKLGRTDSFNTGGGDGGGGGSFGKVVHGRVRVAVIYTSCYHR